MLLFIQNINPENSENLAYCQAFINLYFTGIYRIKYNPTEKLVGLYYYLLENNQVDVLFFSVIKADAVAVRIFKLLSSHCESSLSNSWYVEFVFWLSSEKMQSSAEIFSVRQI